jgi:hypothetical protein
LFHHFFALVKPIPSMSELQNAIEFVNRGRTPKSARTDGKGQSAKGSSSAYATAAVSNVPGSMEVDSSDTSILRDTAKLALLSQAQLRAAFDASSVTFLFDGEERKTVLQDLITAFFENLPKPTEEQRKQQIKLVHPMGAPLKVLCFQFSLKELEKSKPQQADISSEPWPTVQSLLQKNSVYLEEQISELKPKHRQHKQGRKWVWTMSIHVLSDSEFKRLIKVLIDKNTAFSAVSGIEVLFTRSSQQQLEKQLWKSIAQPTTHEPPPWLLLGARLVLGSLRKRAVRSERVRGFQRFPFITGTGSAPDNAC